MAEAYWVLFGAHEHGPNQIKAARFDARTGEISTPGSIVDTPNPAYFILTPDARFLYACNQADSYERGVTGGVSAFEFDDRSGQLVHLNTVSSHGRDPSHLSFDRARRHIFVSNYGSGTFTVLRIASDGSLAGETGFQTFVGSSIDPERQTHPYAHASALDPSGCYVLVCDLGTDRIWILRYREEAGALEGDPASAPMPAGDGPRHLAFHPNGRWLYVNGEMGNCVCRYDWDAERGRLTFRSRTTTLPADFRGASTTAEMLISDDGRRIYVTNRGHDTVVTMALDASTGDPVAVDFVPTGGAKPRNLEFAPDRRWAIVTNHDGHNFTIYAVDAASGRLRPHGTPIALEAPYCPRFIPIRSGEGLSP